MSDFCKQCSETLFNADSKDLAGLSTPEETAKGLYPFVLCEGCGPIQVDHTGQCVSDCLVHHRPLHGKGVKDTTSGSDPSTH